MSEDTTDQTVTTQSSTPVGAPPPAPSGGTPAPAPIAATESVVTNRRTSMTSRPDGSEMTRRVVVLLFGLIQLVIGLRFVLLLLDAREANGLVSGILNLSQLFVAPFDGILRTNALHSAGSVFDVTAVVAFVGWTILELIVLWVAAIFRRERA